MVDRAGYPQWLSAVSTQKVTVFSTTRSKRRTASVVLMAWLFALVSGVANACLLETPALHSTGTQVAPSNTHHPYAEVLVQHETAEGRGDNPSGPRESCLKVCDDGTHTLIKVHAGVDQTDPGPAPLVTTLWSAAMPIVLLPHRAEELHVPLCEPPLRVRYSRLTLSPGKLPGPGHCAPRLASISSGPTQCPPILWGGK